VSVAGQSEKGNSGMESLVGRRTGIGLSVAVFANSEDKNQQQYEEQHHHKSKSVARPSGYSTLNHSSLDACPLIATAEFFKGALPFRCETIRHFACICPGAGPVAE
jgi:hypothetical protein